MVLPLHSERKEEEQVWGEDNVSSVSHVKDEVSFTYPGGDGQEAGGYAGLGKVWLEIPVWKSQVP